MSDTLKIGNCMNDPPKWLTEEEMRGKERGIFVIQLRRAGEDVDGLMKHHRDAGLNNNDATWKAVKELGWPGAPEVRRRELEYVKQWHLSRSGKKGAEAAAEKRAEYRQMTLEEAITTLPNTASPFVEVSWVRSHAKMMEKSLRGKDHAVVVTADDILNSSNGACPSKAAACLLTNWCNKPDEFQEKIIPQLVKQTVGEGEKAGKVASGLPKEMAREILDGFYAEGESMIATDGDS